MHQRGKAEMSGYECPIKFGTSIVPAAATPAEARALARETNGARVDMIGIQDTQGGRLPQQRWCATPTRKRHNGRAGIADRAGSAAASASAGLSLRDGIGRFRSRERYRGANGAAQQVFGQLSARQQLVAGHCRKRPP